MSTLEYKREVSHRLTQTGIQCQDCKFISSLASRKICVQCHSSNLQRINLSGKGTVMTLTTVHYPPSEFVGLEPYDIVLVEMGEGARVVAPAVKSGGPKITIGSEVEATMRKIKTSKDDGIIYYGLKFRPM